MVYVMKSNHLQAMIYAPERVNKLVAELTRLVQSAHPFIATPANESSKLWAPVSSTENTVELMGDGPSDGFEENYKKTAAANEIHALLGQLTWRDRISEKIMWVYAAADPMVLRLRLIALAALLIQWAAEIEFREMSKRKGES